MHRRQRALEPRQPPAIQTQHASPPARYTGPLVVKSRCIPPPRYEPTAGPTRPESAQAYNPQAAKVSASQPSSHAVPQSVSLPPGPSGYCGKPLGLCLDRNGHHYCPTEHCSAPHPGYYGFCGPAMACPDYGLYIPVGGRQGARSESDSTNPFDHSGSPFGWQVPHRPLTPPFQDGLQVGGSEESSVGSASEQAPAAEEAQAGAAPAPPPAPTPAPAQESAVMPTPPAQHEVQPTHAGQAGRGAKAPQPDTDGYFVVSRARQRGQQSPRVSTTSPAMPVAVDQQAVALPCFSPRGNIQLAHGRRKLYIPTLPWGAGYGDVLKHLKGGLIDDIFISEKSHSLGTVHGDKFAYVTFYSEEGARKWVEYLQHVDSLLNRPAMAAAAAQLPQSSSQGFSTVAFLTINGQRMPVLSRDVDQRPRPRNITDAVERQHATRVLSLTFRRGIRLRGSLGDTAGWQAWQDGLSAYGGQSALAVIRRHVEHSGRSQDVDVESVELVQPSSQGRGGTAAAGGVVFKVHVSLVRISDARGAKAVLEQHKQYREHCFFGYAPDPCAAAPAGNQTFLATNYEDQFPPLPSPARPVHVAQLAGNQGLALGGRATQSSASAITTPSEALAVRAAPEQAIASASLDVRALPEQITTLSAALAVRTPPAQTTPSAALVVGVPPEKTTASAALAVRTQPVQTNLSAEPEQNHSAC